MKHTRNILMTVMCTAVAVSLLTVVGFETDTLPCGLLSGRSVSGEFAAATLMELLTLCAIPAALRLFRFRSVASQIVSARALMVWGLVRMLMLCVPMVANTILYYLYMNVAFGYMGIILLISLAFVAPTKARCESEVACNDHNQQTTKA